MQVEHFLKHSEIFDISLAFLTLIVAKLSTLKQVRFLLDHPVYGFISVQLTAVHLQLMQ